MAQRILIVDDDHKIVRLLRASLEQAGYRVLVAYDGETALHTLRCERPDLVVLNLMLPDRDGWNVTRVMRADAALADTPIIMLTARVEHHDRIIGLELGADDYVTKPFHYGSKARRARERSFGSRCLWCSMPIESLEHGQFAYLRFFPMRGILRLALLCA